MRARNIKPGFFANDTLAECSALARLLFIGLWCCADRDGLLEDRPKKIKGCVFPFEDSSECNIESLLSELASRGFIVRYEAKGCKCIAIPTFHSHQRPHRNEKPSVLPRCDKGTTKVRSRSHQGAKYFALNEERGMMNDECGMMNDECVVPDIDSLFSRFWKSFPSIRKTGKRKAQEAFAKACKRADAETIIAAAAEYAASEVGRGEFCKGPTPWLNGDCWLDDRAAWNPSPKSSRLPTAEDLANWNPFDGGVGVQA